MNKTKLTAAVLAAWVLAATVPVCAATLLVANKSDATVDLVDLETGASVATLPTGRGPHEVAASPNGRIAVVSNYGDRSSPGSSLTVIDIARARVLHTIDLGRNTRPHGLAWISDRRIAVTTEGSQRLLVIDPHAGKIVHKIATGGSISHMVVLTDDRKKAFVANIGSGNVTVIDLERGKKLGDVETGEGAEGIAITPDGKQVWVGNRAADTLSVIDAASLEVVATLPCPGFPIRVTITPDGRHALVSCARSGEVAVFDVTERRELKRGKLDLTAVAGADERMFGDSFGKSPVPVGLVVAPDGKRAFVAATQADVVVIVDPLSLEVLDLLRAGHEPDGMAFTTAEVKKKS